MKVTSAIERHLTRGPWWPHRRRLGLFSRRPEQQPGSFEAVYSPDEEPEPIDILPENYPVLLLPDFDRPMMVFGERAPPYKGAKGMLMRQTAKTPVTVNRRKSRALHRRNAKVEIPVNLDVDIFMRFLAKVALAAAVAAYGLEALEEVYVREIILGALEDANSYIGRASSLLARDLTGGDIFRTEVFQIRGNVHVYIQCFAEPDTETPVYEVVVGRLRREGV